MPILLRSFLPFYLNGQKFVGQIFSLAKFPSLSPDKISPNQVQRIW